MLFNTQNPQQTYDLGKKMARQLKGGDILAVSGELGAGKTVLIKGIAAGLGIKQTVRSPSFNLMKVYRIMKHVTRIENFVHLDCYRLKSEREAIEIGLLDYLGRPDTMVAIEWPEKIVPFLKKYQVKKIEIRYLAENCRQINSAPSSGVLDPAGRIYLKPPHPRSPAWRDGVFGEGAG